MPPLDVEWIWTCHMLCPQRYNSDFVKMWKDPDEGNETVDDAILWGKKRRKGIEITRVLWMDRFKGDPYDAEHFLASVPMTGSGQASTQFRISDSSQILPEMVRIANHFRSGFITYYQVALPHYGNINSVTCAVERFAKFPCAQPIRTQHAASADIRYRNSVARTHVASSELPFVYPYVVKSQLKSRYSLYQGVYTPQ